MNKPVWVLLASAMATLLLTSSAAAKIVVTIGADHRHDKQHKHHYYKHKHQKHHRIHGKSYRDERRDAYRHHRHKQSIYRDHRLKLHGFNQRYPFHFYRYRDEPKRHGYIKHPPKHYGHPHKHNIRKYGYWKDYHRAGYKHRYYKKHHYYYNRNGFYFPGYGYISHGHKHGRHCPDWHREPFVAGLVLSAILGG